MTPVHAAAEVVDVGNAARVAAIPLVRGRDDGRKSRLVLEGTPRPSGEIDLQDQLGEEARGGCRCGFWCVLATRHLFHLLVGLRSLRATLPAALGTVNSVGLLFMLFARDRAG
jgi:hypothetical protein